MRNGIAILILFCSTICFAQRSGATIKVGFLLNDYLRDDRSILSRSQSGAVIGLDIRLGAEDNTYFKLGGYYGRLHFLSQDHFRDTRFFKVEDGYDMLKGLCGIETRLINLYKLKWRLGASGSFTFIPNVLGGVQFADLHDGLFGINVSTGIDILFLGIDISLEQGLGDFLSTQSNTKPLTLMLTIGAHF